MDATALSSSAIRSHTAPEPTTKPIPAQLEQLSPTIEAVNMGSGAYGVDQMYLFYKRDGIALGTNLLVVAFVEDDFKRMTSDTFRLVRPKPQLVVRGNTLALSNVPVPTVGPLSSATTALFKILHRAGEQLFNHDVFPSGRAHFRRLEGAVARASSGAGACLLAVGAGPAGFKPSTTRHRAPRRTDRQRQADSLLESHKHVSSDSGFRRVRSYFVPDGHYSPRGNRLVATTLLELLQRQFPMDSRTTPLP